MARKYISRIKTVLAGNKGTANRQAGEPGKDQCLPVMERPPVNDLGLRCHPLAEPHL